MRTTLIALVLLAPPCWAQQQPSMPSMPGMPDMDHGMPMPKQQSPKTQAPTGTTPKPGAQSDAQSFSHDTLALQEPENPAHHTGSILPAPELLAEEAARAPMRLEDFLTMAQHGNPTLAQAEASVRVAEQQGRQVGLAPNPSIGYSGDHIRGGSYGGGEEGAYVQQEFVLGGKLGLRRDVYRQQAQANRIGVDEQQQRVKNSVQQAFYSALAAQTAVALQQRMVRVAEDAAETAHQLANIGQADAPDILQAELEAEKAQVQFVHAQRDYLQAFATLSAVAGAETLPVTPLTGDIEDPPAIDPEQQLATLTTRNPTIARAQQRVAVAEAQLKAAKREPIPNLTVKAGEWYSGEQLGSTPVAAGPMSFVDAGINLPIWNRNQGNIEAAKVNLERAQNDVTRTRLLLHQQVAPLVQQYQSAQFEAARYRDELLPRARRAYQLYLMKYQQMASAYPQVLISQQSLFQLQMDYLQALSMEWSSALALENNLLGGGLATPESDMPAVQTINPPGGGGQ